MLSGLLMISAAVMLGQVLGFSAILPVATTIGVLAGLVQMLGLLRWVYLVPSLARAYADVTAGPEQREASLAIFRAMHQYAGVGIGEHLGYLLTGLWSILIGVTVVLGESVPSLLGWPGVLIGAGLVLGSAEFLGPNEERGWGVGWRRDPGPVHRLVRLAVRAGDRIDRVNERFRQEHLPVRGREDRRALGRSPVRAG